MNGLDEDIKYLKEWDELNGKKLITESKDTFYSVQYEKNTLWIKEASKIMYDFNLNNQSYVSSEIIGSFDFLSDIKIRLDY
jgi:hypothetical protein